MKFVTPLPILSLIAILWGVWTFYFETYKDHDGMGVFFIFIIGLPLAIASIFTNKYSKDIKTKIKTEIVTIIAGIVLYYLVLKSL